MKEKLKRAWKTFKESYVVIIFFSGFVIAEFSIRVLDVNSDTALVVWAAATAVAGLVWGFKKKYKRWKERQIARDRITKGLWGLVRQTV